MSTAAAFGPADWLGRLVTEVTCGDRVAMSSGRSKGRGGGHPWGGWGAAPWGSGWPRSGDWWAGGPGRPRAGRGDVRSAILALLAESPRHGYQIIQDIAERSGGAWRASPGSVYPALAALQDEGLVDDEKVDGRRVYTLTEAGRAHVDERAAELAAVFSAFGPAQDRVHDEDYGRLLFSVGAAAVEVVRTGSPGQVAAARRLLTQVRHDLYGLLAGNDDPDDPDDGEAPAP